MKKPYLVQRAKINSPLANASDTLSVAVALDYMGSAEFEFGALPESLRRMEESSADLVLRKVVNISAPNGGPLRVLSTMNDEEFSQYEKYLQNMRSDKIDLKETSGFTEVLNPHQSRTTDFWWDVENDVMFSFNKNFMNRLTDYLESSWKLMNKNSQSKLKP